jgi:LPXTG-site transpeptidase (sortase) family protein
MKNPLNILFSPKEALFIGWFMLIFLGSAGVLALFGLLPDEFTEQSDGRTLSEKVVESAVEVVTDTNIDTNLDTNVGDANSNELPNNAFLSTSQNTSKNPSQRLTQTGLPVRLIIPSIAVDTKIYIPRSTATAVLDADLQKGPVYYPGSGTINTGNMFIFGHSTSHAVVINRAYKVFNELKNLTSSDIIYVESEGKRFAYRVRSVDKVDKDETLVTFDTKAHLLTLSTCNSFGSKSDRFVVVAEFVQEVR